VRKLAVLVLCVAWSTVVVFGRVAEGATPATTTTQLTITPTTTLTAETSNNTSAADSFAGQSNGNLKASNISKVSLKSVLYPGFNGKMYVHLMGWFGGTNHVSVGYQSDSATQVQRQVNDMISRGADGAIIDYYGPNDSRINNVTLLLRDEAAKHSGFQFAVDEDAGALLACSKTEGCDLTSQLISDLTYIHDNFQTSPAYITFNGRPIVLFFDIERYGKIDWTRVTSSVPGNPMFIQRSAGGFTYTATSGSYAWVMINTTNANDIETSYLDNFYYTGMKYPAELTMGTAYKGFNDTIAAWSGNRIMNQNCGQTWLATLAETGKYYNTATQLASFQITTWNDYEEGTEIESGIDNCVSISASANGTQLNWSISGNENTVHHYTVFVSTDGQNLMKLADVAAGTHTLNVGGYNLAPGSYTLYVKAVGQPSMLNHISGAVPLTIQNQPPVINLAMSATSGMAPVAVTANLSGSYDPDGSIASSAINFGDGTVVTNAMSAQHTYSTPGTYTVTATVTDNLGASAKTTTTVNIAAPTPGYVSVASPTNNWVGDASSPVHFGASAVGAANRPITAMRIYVDDVSMYTVSAAKLDTYLKLAAGSHRVVVVAWDNTGASYASQVTINLIASGVSIASPTSNWVGYASSPVHFVASAMGTANRPITAMRIYVDNVSMYTVAAAKIDTYLKLAAGSHKVVVVAWDNTGASYSAQALITLK
jgi:PKD repeat protein